MEISRANYFFNISSLSFRISGAACSCFRFSIILCTGKARAITKRPITPMTIPITKYSWQDYLHIFLVPGRICVGISSSRDVINRIGISLFSSRTVCANSKPSTSGIMISEMITSTGFVKDLFMLQTYTKKAVCRTRKRQHYIAGWQKRWYIGLQHPKQGMPASYTQILIELSPYCGLFGCLIHRFRCFTGLIRFRNYSFYCFWGYICIVFHSFSGVIHFSRKVSTNLSSIFW